MARKYLFGEHDNDINNGVECPEMDALLDDMMAVCRKHRVGLTMENEYRDDARARLQLVMFTPESPNVDPIEPLLTGLRGYDGNVPWLQEAKVLYDAHRRQLEHAKREERREQERRAKLLAEQHIADQAIANGVLLAGKRYKLVPEE